MKPCTEMLNNLQASHRVKSHYHLFESYVFSNQEICLIGHHCCDSICTFDQDCDFHETCDNGKCIEDKTKLWQCSPKVSESPGEVCHKITVKGKVLNHA